MRAAWVERNTIVANLFNPAFCGEVIRLTIKEYNKNSVKRFPFPFTFLILPILLHKETRDRLPKTVRTYLFVWVEENDDLFLDFASRTRSMVKYTKEALSFLLAYSRIEFTKEGEIIASPEKVKVYKHEEYQEYNEILKRAEMLGKWLATTSDVVSVPKNRTV